MNKTFSRFVPQTWLDENVFVVLDDILDEVVDTFFDAKREKSDDAARTPISRLASDGSLWLAGALAVSVACGGGLGVPSTSSVGTVADATVHRDENCPPAQLSEAERADPDYVSDPASHWKNVALRRIARAARVEPIREAEGEAPPDPFDDVDA